MRETRDGLVSINECSKLTGQSTRTIRRLIDSGKLPAIRWGRNIRIAKADLLAAGQQVHPASGLGRIVEVFA